VDHEFVVRKQVQNRAIVREVDEARQRDLVRTVAGGACVLATHGAHRPSWPATHDFHLLSGAAA